MSDEEFVELSQLSKAKQKVREDRAAMIAGLRETLGSHGITIQELFTVDEIAAALPTAAPLEAGLRVRSRRGPRAVLAHGCGKNQGWYLWK